jgi:uncharacterized protein (DUF1499 family)
MSFDQVTLPWEVFTVLAILTAMLTIFSMVRWVFRPRPKRLPAKRLLLFLACISLVFYAYNSVDAFPDKFQAGLRNKMASTTDDPQFEELRTPYFPRSRQEVFDASIRAINSMRGWSLTNQGDSGTLLEAEVSAMLGIFTDQVLISLLDEGGRTRVDVQSTSLKGGSDFGANRRHIAQFLLVLERELGVPREAK